MAVVDVESDENLVKLEQSSVTVERWAS